MSSITLFSSSPGQLVRINSTNPLPLQLMQLSFAGMPIGPGYQATKKILVTSIAVRENGNIQLLHTLDDSVYAYIFGDRIGSVSVSGLCFHDAICQNNLINTAGGNGFQDVITMYRANRASMRPFPMNISIAGRIYAGFLNGLQMTANDPASGIGNWTYEFLTLPPRAI